MAAEPILATLEATVAEGRAARFAAWADYLALTKPEVNFLIVVTTFAGFYLGCATELQNFSFLQAIHTVWGTLLAASGAGVLNQYIERRFDAQMRRTARRPLAAGRLDASAVLGFGVTLSVTGPLYLAFAVNGLACGLAIFTLLAYLFFYTPIKRKSSLCTLVGAIPGAMPPLIGWAGVSGQLPREAWALFGILFLWQFPHFMAIAWMYREDYDRAGYLVLPRGASRTRVAILQTLLPLVVLVPVSAIAIASQPGVIYSIGALLLSLGYLYCGLQFAFRRSGSAARRLLGASILYLPALFTLRVITVTYL
jgi:protoheme IX farnesyltransferase